MQNIQQIMAYFKHGHFVLIVILNWIGIPHPQLLNYQKVRKFEWPKKKHKKGYVNKKEVHKND